MPWNPFSSTRSISISYRQEAVSEHRGPRNRSVVGKLVRDRFGSASEVSAFECQVSITPMNRHRQFDWVALRNIGRRPGRAVDIPGVYPSERDASQLLRWRQRSSLTHAATRTASCFIDRARVCAGPNAFPSVTDRTRARRGDLKPSSLRSAQTSSARPTMTLTTQR